MYAENTDQFPPFSYSDHQLTDAEFMSLAPAMQERVKRTAMTREGGSSGWNNYYQPVPAGAGRCKRVGKRENPFICRVGRY